MLIDLLKAFLLGILASIPVGPVAVLVAQKTLCSGYKAGIYTSIGTAFVDTLYAVVSLFAVSMVQDFIMRNKQMFLLLGGALIIVIGVYLFMKSRQHIDFKVKTKISTSSYVGYAFQAAGCAFANPGAFALMLGLVALVRLDLSTTLLPTWLIIVFIVVGTMSYWILFTSAIAKARVKMSPAYFSKVYKFSGVAIVLFGLFILIKGVNII